MPRSRAAFAAATRASSASPSSSRSCVTRTAAAFVAASRSRPNAVSSELISAFSARSRSCDAVVEPDARADELDVRALEEPGGVGLEVLALTP